MEEKFYGNIYEGYICIDSLVNFLKYSLEFFHENIANQVFRKEWLFI